MAITKSNQTTSNFNSITPEAGNFGYLGSLIWIVGSIIVSIIFIALDLVFLSSINSYGFIYLIQIACSLIVTFAGLFFILKGVKYLSVFYKNKEIYNNFIISFIILLASLIIIPFFNYITTQLAVGSLYSSASNSTIYNITQLSNPIQPIFSIISIAVLSIVIGLVLSLLSYFFMYRSYKKISQLTGITEFNTAALIIIIGAILTIIVIGGLVIFIGLVYAGLAWYKLKNGTAVNSPDGKAATAPKKV